MTASSNPVPENPDEKRKDPKALQKLKFYGVVVLLTVLCIGFIWFLFKPDETKQPEGSGGLNTEMPDATVQTTMDDKRKAVEQEEFAERQREKTRSLMDFNDGSLLPTAKTKEEVDPDAAPAAAPATAAAPDPIKQSQETYRQINRQLTGFYENRGDDPQVAELKRQLVELAAKVDANKADPNSDPFAIMEKSYELANRYFPQDVKSVGAGPVAEKIPAERVRRQTDEVTSSLTESIDLAAQERNYGFVTAVGTQTAAPSNAIRACVNDDQVVTAGARVCLRLLEPLRAGGCLVPVNAPLYGNARIEGQRLSIVVTSIESDGSIIPVELNVHDMDGQKGLYIPNTMERTALKDAAASIGAGFGSSISMAQSAGQQVAMDLTRGVMTGGTQYLSSKMREVKINLKANYQILLISKE